MTTKGSLIDHVIDYNAVAVLRRQWHITNKAPPLPGGLCLIFKKKTNNKSPKRDVFLSLRKFVMLGKVRKVIFFERFGLMQRAGIRQIVQRDSNEKRALVFVSPRSLSIFFADLLTFLAVDVNFLSQENEKKKKTYSNMKEF